MEWPHGKPVPVPYHDHIYESFEGTGDIVFRFSASPRAMINHHLTDLKSTHFQERRDEAMHFSIERDLVKTFLAIGLEGASAIMDTIFNQDFTELIGDTTHKFLGERILTVFTPSGDYIKLMFFKVSDESRSIRRIVLQVTIHRDDVWILCSLDPRIKRRRLAKIGPHTDDGHRTEGLEDFVRTIRGTIVHHDDLKVSAEGKGYAQDLLV